MPRIHPFYNLTGTEHAFLVFVICMVVLLLPKVLALVDLAFDRARRRAFGGLTNATVSTLAETVFSTLHAPLLMLWHTRFVITLLLGKGVNWGTQKRTAGGTAWFLAVRRHWGHTAIGIVWGALVWRMDRTTFWWFLPVFSGMVLSIPFSVFTSRAAWGRRVRQSGLFLTPEETAQPAELASLRTRMATQETAGETTPQLPDSGLADVVLDPYVNAIHVSLLRELRLNPLFAEALARIGGPIRESPRLGEKLAGCRARCA